MFVKTQFDKIVNLAEFQSIRIKWFEQQPSGNIFHVIRAESEEIIKSTGVNEHPKSVLKSETLAQFPKDMQKQAQFAYTDLFNALLNKDTAFDITGYQGTEIR